MTLITLLQDKAIPLDAEERLNLVIQFKAWLEGPPPTSTKTPFGDTAGEIRRLSSAMFVKLARRVEQDEPAAGVIADIIRLDQDFVSTDAALPSLVRLRVVTAEEAARRIDTLLRDPVPGVRSPLPEIFYDLSRCGTALAEFSVELWTAAALAVVSRRAENLLHLLSMFAFEYRDRSQGIPDAVDPILETALWLIKKETAPDSEVTVTYNALTARFFAARLVAAMTRAARIKVDLIDGWSTAAATDAIPDVRRALEQFAPNQ